MKSISICSLGLVSLLLFTAPAAAETPAPTPTGEIIVRVIDSSGAPQGAATVSFSTFDNAVRLFREMSPALAVESSGIARLERLASENGYYLVRARTKDGRVGYRTCLLDGKDARQKVDITVLPSLAAKIHVTDESGKPIAGATIWSLNHRSVNAQLKRLHGEDLKRAMELATAPSNESGDLTLPELPEGAIDVKLVHPDYAPAFLSDFAIKSGASRELVMRRGVKLTLHIEAPDNGKLPSGLTLDLQHFPYDNPSTLDGPLPEPSADGTIQFTVAAGEYAGLSITHPGFIVTPQYQTIMGHGPADGYECFKIAPGTDQFSFQLHRKVKVRGRILRENGGKPVAENFVWAQLRTQTQTGPFARFALKWTQAGVGYTNDRGEFETDLASGRASLQVLGGGFMPPFRFEFDVAPDGPTKAQDIVVKPMPKVRGIVRDQSGKPLKGTVVGFRNSELASAAERVITDDKGRFELSPPYVPSDWKTEESKPLQTVVAFHPYEPLAGEARVNLVSASSLDNVAVDLKPQDYGSLIGAYPGDLSSWERGEMPADQKEHLTKMSLVGKPAPELDGAAWLNTDKPKMSLADFRGKYVLLQIWATWCGPCHDDMPSVKLVNRLYKDKGFAVIGVHDNSMPLEDIKEDAKKNGLTYPIVVDHPDGRLLAAYNGHGFQGYPSYILIGPDGKIVKDDQTVASPSLRSFKVELIRQYLMSPPAGVGAALRVEKKKVLVTSVLPDSAAVRSGALHPNDQIVAIAEEHGEPVDVAGLPLEKVVALVRGRNGTVVRLTIIPAEKDASEARVISLVRGHVNTPFGGLSDGKPLTLGTHAPNVKFTRLDKETDDELDHHRGKVVILIAWASWCKPCLEHLAKLDALVAEHAEWNGRVEILPVSIDERREDAAASAKSQHWKALSTEWAGPAICVAYHINGVPTTYVIGRDGTIVAADSRLDIAALIEKQRLLDEHKK